MFKRASLASIILMLLSTASVSAATKTVDIVAGNVFQPKILKVAMGTDVVWHNADTVAHSTIADSSSTKLGFWNISMGGGLTAPPVTFNNAGTYPYHGDGYLTHGKIKVPMTATPTSGTTATPFIVRFAVANTNSLYTHDLQQRKKGGTWATILSTAGQTYTFHPANGGTWQFRARVRYLADGRSTGWSPILSIDVS